MRLADDRTCWMVGSTKNIFLPLLHNPSDVFGISQLVGSCVTLSFPANGVTPRFDIFRLNGYLARTRTI